MKKRVAGFTLIEIMIAIAIIGVLAAIAIPNYQKYMVRGKQAGAKAVLLEIAQRQAQYQVDSRGGFSNSLTTLNVTPPSDISAAFTFTITVASPPPTFTAKAEPRDASGGDIWMSIDEGGIRATGATGNAASTGSW